MHARAPGKLNLFFKVGETQEDGYHDVASVYQAVSLYEDVWAEHAADFVYADAIDRAAPPTPIGISCRICPRPDCDQRAFPPAGSAISIDPDRRSVVPYAFS